MLKSLKVLVKGSILANMITILISPIITRIYSPENFGLYTLFITIITLFGPIINLKYEMAIVKSKSLKEEYNLIVISLFIGLFLSFILSITYGYYIYLNSNLNFYFVFAICFMLLFFTSINNTFMSINNKYKEYNIISQVTILRAISNSFFTLILGFFQYTKLGLVISQLTSLLTGISRQSKTFFKNIKGLNLVSRGNILSNFKGNLNFLFFTSSSALLATSIYSSIIIFISYEYSNYELGFYSLGFRILGLPFTIVSVNVAKVFYEKSINLNSDFHSLFKNTLFMMLKIIMPLIIFIAIFSPFIFGIVFGNEWKVSGYYVLILAPLFCFKLIYDSLNTTFIVVNKQSIEFFLQLLLVVLSLILYFLVSIFELNIYIFLVLISLMYTLFYIFNLLYMYKLSKLF
ncbi:oligosaccharide flippase family protein [Macrococcoides canis]|uniref:Oligosaccharide flippase family protein n=1 Tax=Macrococcoides canis TaxID=1855823 RepID=A0A4V3BFR4_9STAP|nr:oligosaccharide flippase family protein [Macrococcus canis]TDM15259.1 hypothetical protein ETI04_10195 [Macrococcus canis]